MGVLGNGQEGLKRGSKGGTYGTRIQFSGEWPPPGFSSPTKQTMVDMTAHDRRTTLLAIQSPIPHDLHCASYRHSVESKQSAWKTRLHVNEFLSGGGTPIMEMTRMYKAPKTPYFQPCCHPMTPYVCWLSLQMLSPNDPLATVLGEMWAFQSLKDPLFCIRLAHQEANFLFQFHPQTNHFCHFFFWLQILLLKRSLKDQK